MTGTNNTTEIWKVIDGFENYAVSNFGFVKRIITNKHHPKERILKNAQDSDGYHVVTLYAQGKQKTKKVHRLVARAFLGECLQGYEVNHINGKKGDNFIDNLEYVTAQENKDHAVKHRLTALGERNAMRKYPEKVRRGSASSLYGRNHTGSANGHSKLNESQVLEIRKEIENKEKLAVIARKYNVTPELIGMIKRRQVWNHI